MPMHPDFKKILSQFQARYGDAKGAKLFYAWVQKRQLDDTKPYAPDVQLKKSESFQWAKPLFKLLKSDDAAKYYQVEAHFAVTSMNGNVYTLDELLQAVHTLPGKHVDLNHNIEWVMAPVEITAAMVEDECAECIIRVPNGVVDAKNRDVQECFDNAVYHSVSIEADSLDSYPAMLEDGVVGNKPVGLSYTGLAVLDEDALPGIPLTSIRPLESLMESIFKENEGNTEEVTHEDMTDKVEKQNSTNLEGEKIIEMANELAGKIKETAELTQKLAKLQEKYNALDEKATHTTTELDRVKDANIKLAEDKAGSLREVASARSQLADALKREGETSEKLAAETQKRIEQEGDIKQLREDVHKRDEIIITHQQTIESLRKTNKDSWKKLNKLGVYEVDATGNLVIPSS